MELQELQQLIARYNAGEASTEERALLEQWYESIQGDTTGIQQSQLPGIRADIYAALPAYMKPKRKMRQLYRWAAAAALVMGIGAGIYFFKSPARNIAQLQPNQELPNDIAPGSARAILTLGDGTQLTLDNKASNGQLATREGIVINKNADGQIVYTSQTGHQPAAFHAKENVISTPRGGIYAIVLPDGTKVWLNAASALKFPTFFSGSDRTVALTGEAYFEVAQNAEQPFRVICGKETIEVLGTHFNISNYSDETTITTTLLEGSIRVKAGQQSQVLQPGQQSVINTADDVNNQKLTAANTDEVMAWKNGMFYFNNADISTIMRQVARWYDVEVEFQGPLPADEFKGKISRDVNASQVLQILALSGINFKIEGRKIILR